MIQGLAVGIILGEFNRRRQITFIGPRAGWAHGNMNDYYFAKQLSWSSREKGRWEEGYWKRKERSKST